MATRDASAKRMASRPVTDDVRHAVGTVTIVDQLGTSNLCSRIVGGPEPASHQRSRCSCMRARSSITAVLSMMLPGKQTKI